MMESQAKLLDMNCRHCAAPLTPSKRGPQPTYCDSTCRVNALRARRKTWQSELAAQATDADRITTLDKPQTKGTHR